MRHRLTAMIAELMGDFDEDEEEVALQRAMEGHSPCCDAAMEVTDTLGIDVEIWICVVCRSPWRISLTDGKVFKCEPCVGSHMSV